MSAESELRAALVAHAPLLAVVPSARISINAVDPEADRPYIAFSKQGVQRDLGLDSTVLGTISTIDVQCIGVNQEQCIAVAALVLAALAAAGQPSRQGSAGYDPDNDLPAEVVTVDWMQT